MTSPATVSLLEPLPYLVCFYYAGPTADWPEIFRQVTDPQPVDLYHWKFNSNPAPNWILQTYVQLRRRGLHVSLTDRLLPGRINVVYRCDVGYRQRSDQSYVVSCRCDSARPWLAHHAIVQNPLNVLNPQRDHLVQHWPQPGLISRNSNRGDHLERLVYKGGIANLWEGFRSTAFQNEMTQLGVQWIIDGPTEASKPTRWHDYQIDDALLAVRDLTETDYRVKPASKLINAWHAGVPALLGPENAFQSLRKSELDYFEVRNIKDVVRVVRRLKAEPKLYAAVVANGLERAKAFTVDQIAGRWREILAGPVAEGYQRWLEHGAVRRWFRPISFAARTAMDKLEIRRYIRQRDHGFRPISGTHT